MVDIDRRAAERYGLLVKALKAIGKPADQRSLDCSRSDRDRIPLAQRRQLLRCDAGRVPFEHVIRALPARSEG